MQSFFAVHCFCINNVYVSLSFTDFMFRLRIYLIQKDQNQMLLWYVGESSHTVDVGALKSFGAFQLCDMICVVLDSARG